MAPESRSHTTTPAAARCSMTRPARTTTTYDADGRTTLVVNPAGLRLTYAYDAASQRKYLIEPEGARFTYVFDADGRTSYVANPQAQRRDLQLRRRQPGHRHSLRQHDPRFVSL